MKIENWKLRIGAGLVALLLLLAPASIQGAARSVHPRVGATNSLAGSGGGSFTANTISFPTVDDYLSRSALSGEADGKAFSLSLFIKRTRSSGGSGFEEFFFSIGVPNSGAGVNAFFSLDDKLSVTGFNAAGSKILEWTAGAAITDTAWHHFAFSANLAGADYSTHLKVIIDGTADTTAPSFFTDDALDLTQNHAQFGGDGFAFRKFIGCISEAVYDPTEYNVVANIANFYSGGHPVDPGSTGTGFGFGHQPLLYLRAGTSGANAGTGGDFTPAGSLTTCTAP